MKTRLTISLLTLLISTTPTFAFNSTPQSTDGFKLIVPTKPQLTTDFKYGPIEYHDFNDEKPPAFHIITPSNTHKSNLIPTNLDTKITSDEALNLVKAEFTSIGDFKYEGIEYSNYGVYGKTPPAFHIISHDTGKAAVHTETGEMFFGTQGIPEKIIYNGFPTLTNEQLYEIATDIFGSSNTIVGKEQVVDGRT
ncbi:MAG: hypothetical protein ATN34_01515, partial [Epulopiscium sp. Nele67-Bin002]